MYKITCFSPITPEKLGQALLGLSFKKVNESYEWRADGYFFRIEPFKHQPRDSYKGYRVYFNGSIDGGVYLFDMAMGWSQPSVKGIEYELEIPNKNSKEWIDDLIKKPQFTLVDAKGIFRRGKVWITIINDKAFLQIRPTNKKQLKTVESLQEIESIKEKITPVTFDLFSFLEEAEVG